MAKADRPLSQLLRDPATAPLTPAATRELFAYTDTQAKSVFDERDSAHDRLFAAIMARMDAMQTQREAYLTVTARLQRQLPLWPLLVRQSGLAVETILRDAGLLADDRRRHLQIAGLLAVLAATLRAWQRDESADLSATLRACDTALRRGATAAAWVGFVS